MQLTAFDFAMRSPRPSRRAAFRYAATISLDLEEKLGVPSERDLEPLRYDLLLFRTLCTRTPSVMYQERRALHLIPPRAEIKDLAYALSATALGYDATLTYAMSGTGLGCTLRCCYALSGTDVWVVITWEQA
eukprot:3941207-Rhodomonas_salina.1